MLGLVFSRFGRGLLKTLAGEAKEPPYPVVMVHRRIKRFVSHNAEVCVGLADALNGKYQYIRSEHSDSGAFGSELIPI